MPSSPRRVFVVIASWFAGAVSLIVAGPALAQSSGGDFPITMMPTTDSTLTLYDCLNNPGEAVGFQYVFQYAVSQQVEYYLSNDMSCPPPPGSVISAPGQSNSPSSAPLETIDNRVEPADQMTTTSDSTTGLTIGGLWGYYAASQTTPGASGIQYDGASTACPSSVPTNATVYLCILMSAPSKGSFEVIDAYFPIGLSPQTTPGIPYEDAGTQLGGGGGGSADGGSSSGTPEGCNCSTGDAALSVLALVPLLSRRRRRSRS